MRKTNIGICAHCSEKTQLILFDHEWICVHCFFNILNNRKKGGQVI